MRRTAAAAALALLALAGAPAVRVLSPSASAQEKEKEKEKDKDKEKDKEKDKDAERRKKEEEEERKRREKARLEKAITAIANSFAAEDVRAVLVNVADDAKVVLRLSETDRKGEGKAYSKEQARGVLEAFFKDWKIIRVDTRSISADQNVASFPLALFKDGADGEKKGSRLRIKVGTQDRHPLVKLVVEW